MDGPSRESPTQQLNLDPLSESSWRLCDGALQPCDAESVLAYVELRDDGRYEVIWVAHVRGRAEFDTLGEVLEWAARRLTAPVRPRTTKPIPIPHRSPRRR